MSDFKELKDEDLEKVSGGIRYEISGVDVGDVFILNSNPSMAIIAKSNVDNNGNDTEIPVVSVRKEFNGSWSANGNFTYNFTYLKQHCTHSPELTGTLNHLLK